MSAKPAAILAEPGLVEARARNEVRRWSTNGPYAAASTHSTRSRLLVCQSLEYIPGSTMHTCTPNPPTSKRRPSLSASNANLVAA